MKRLAIPLLFLTLLAGNKSKSAPVVPDPSGRDVLARGTNLSNWFNDYSDPGQYDSRFPPATLRLIKSIGFTYVRLPIGATILFNPGQPDQLNAARLPKVDSAIARCIHAGLGVTINFQPGNEINDSLLAADPTFADKISSYWKAMALYFRKYPANRLFFEVYNEPHATGAKLTTKGPGWWQEVQGKMVAAIRQVTAEHFIIVGGEYWNSIKGLLRIQPYPFKNIIYNFHFYEPFFFTHQGATWVNWQALQDARGVPYPSTPEGVAPLIIAARSQDLKGTLQWYGGQRYNIDSLDKMIAPVAAWAKTNKVRVMVNEFGSFKNFVPRQSRLNYLHDIRTVFEKYHFDWAMWDCDEGFGWLDYPGNDRRQPTADRGVLASLGMQ